MLLLSWRRLCALFTFSLVASGVSAATLALPDFTELVERQGAAVVNISSSTVRQERPQLPLPLPGMDESDPMFEFFRKLIPRMPELFGPDADSQSLGSGFIISDDGYILTNAHVIENGEDILVRLADKREFNAVVVGTDTRTDLALLRISASGLPKVVLGDPSQLKVGEWVVAIGSPFGFEQSVTAGIISAKGRALPDENFVPFIQTDVAINPGNSGGPLFNLKGEVIGINSQIYSRTGGFMGVSFAIPIDVAMDIQQQLRSKGRVQRGRIGVAIQEVTRALADAFGLENPEGALVSSVEADSPAAKAGIEQGDVILSFAGRTVSSSNDLPRIVAASQPGSEVEVVLHRQGAQQTVRITVGEWQDASDGERPLGSGRAAPVSNRLGLSVALPTSTQRRERGIDQGLVVERAQGAAARAEIRPGDVVLAAVVEGRQQRLDSVEQFNRIAQAVPAEGQLTLLVRRGEATSYVSLRAGNGAAGNGVQPGAAPGSGK